MMLFSASAGCVAFAFLVDSLKGGLEWIVLIVAAVTALGVAYRFLSRIAGTLETMVDLITGDATTPGLAARLEGLEREMTKLRKSTTSLTDLARDESVADVRTLLRRGEVPHPLVDEGEEPG
jgi:hypothetical protein